MQYFATGGRVILVQEDEAAPLRDAIRGAIERINCDVHPDNFPDPPPAAADRLKAQRQGLEKLLVMFGG